MKIILKESQLDNIIMKFFDEDYYPDYGWEKTNFYEDELKKYEDYNFYINDKIAYTYFDDGSMEISRWLIDELNLKFGDNWKGVFKKWFEMNTGLKVYDMVTESQNKHLQESFTNKSIEAIKNHWKKQLEKGNEIRFDFDELKYWGINEFSERTDAQIAFQKIVGDEEFAEKFIKGLMNKTFSTKDFSEKLVGGYDFEWIITQMNYQDFDFFLYGQTLPGGSVTIMDGSHWTLQEALNDEELSWEIQQEVNDVIENCMTEIILPVTGYEVTVPLIYIAEE